MSFVDVCRNIYKMNTPLVIVSAYTAMKPKAIRYGADGFLLKPVTRQDVIEIFASITAIAVDDMHQAVSPFVSPVVSRPPSLTSLQLVDELENS